MSRDRRNPKLKHTLPDVIDPPDSLCFSVPVPNNRYHIAAFRGALLSLASAVNWQDDPDHTAKDVANVWKKIYDDVFPCEDCEQESNGVQVEDDEMNLRIDPDDPCIIQIRCGEDEWKTWYDPRNCIADGVVTNPSPGGELSAGECKFFTVTLRGNDKWILPVPVTAGDIVTIFDTKGGWSFDGITWRCPNGQNYSLGLCYGSPPAAGSGFPLPTAPVGRVIVSIDDVFYDAYNREFSIASGVTSSDVIFQMNDDNLADNAGSISFNVKVCRPASDWSHTFNFAVSDGGWHTIAVDAGVSAEWVAGVGWSYGDQQIVAGNYYRAVQIDREFPEAHLTSISVTYNLSGKEASVDPTGGSDVSVNGANYCGQTLQDMTEGTGVVYDCPADVAAATSVHLQFNSSGDFGTAHYAGSIVLTSVTLSGVGANPF